MERQAQKLDWAGLTGNLGTYSIEIDLKRFPKCGGAVSTVGPSLASDIITTCRWPLHELEKLTAVQLDFIFKKRLSFSLTHSGQSFIGRYLKKSAIVRPLGFL